MNLIRPLRLPLLFVYADAMFSNIVTLFSRLGNAEFAGLLVEPLLLYGILFGVIFFTIGHYLGQPKCRVAALAVIGACSLSIVPYLSLRHHARQLETGGHSAATATQYDEQTKRVADVKWIYLALTISAALALLGGGKVAQISNIAIIAGGIFVVFLSAWLAMKNAEIYHPNTKVRVAKVPGSR
jgi:hypothetical protein